MLGGVLGEVVKNTVGAKDVKARTTRRPKYWMNYL